MSVFKFSYFFSEKGIFSDKKEEDYTIGENIDYINVETSDWFEAKIVTLCLNLGLFFPMKYEI